MEKERKSINYHKAPNLNALRLTKSETIYFNKQQKKKRISLTHFLRDFDEKKK